MLKINNQEYFKNFYEGFFLTIGFVRKKSKNFDFRAKETDRQKMKTNDSRLSQSKRQWLFVFLHKIR